MNDALRWPAGVTRMLRVAIVVRSTHVARALRYIVELGGAGSVVAESREAGDPSFVDSKIDVTIVDVDELSVPIEESFAACMRVAPQGRLVALSSQLRPRLMQRVLAANADAFVVKDTTPDIFHRILKSVAAGESYADPRIAGALLRRRPTRSSDAFDLSMRETEIVRLIADGLSNREIGVRLALSEKTIKNHVSHILAKLKVTARSGVAVYAIRRGIVS